MISFLSRHLILLCLIAPAATAAYADGVVITAVGDIMLAGSGSRTLAQQGLDHAFGGTVGELRKGDILVGNLEAPITTAGVEFSGKKFRFRTRPETAEILSRIGFSVLTLANNHIMDFGAGGLSDTLRYLDRAGIRHAGAGTTLSEARREALVQVKGKRVAFLAYSLTYPEEFFARRDRPGTAPGLDASIREDVGRMRPAADYVVVSVHWGAEGKGFPKAYQQRVARVAIDAGADLVLGHHPHVLQGVERYRGRTIFYSLGNFTFGSRSVVADRSMIARITLNGVDQRADIVPINVLNSEVRFRPTVLAGGRAQEVIQRINRLSEPFNTRLIASGGGFMVQETRTAAGYGR